MNQRIPRFQILELIGQGQFSNVYKARMVWPSDGLTVASASNQHPVSISNVPNRNVENCDQLQLLDFNSEPLDPQEISQRDSFSGAFEQIHPSTSAVTSSQQEQTDQQQQEEKYVALKRIKFYEIQNSKMRMDCIKEVKLLQQLNHPNIINYSISFIERNELYIVLELADGGDLSKLIKYFQRRHEYLSEKIITKYFSQVCLAVRYIHSKRILHRDIKPANIFMTSDGCVKLGDFGLGRFFGQNTRDAHSYVGTFYYMSPERIRESGYDFSSDVWSLGCVLYELITLFSPFSVSHNKTNYSGTFIGYQVTDSLQWIIDRILRGEYPSLEKFSSISRELRQLAIKCLSLKPEDRPDMDLVCRVVNRVYEMQIMSCSDNRNEFARQ